MHGERRESWRGEDISGVPIDEPKALVQDLGVAVVLRKGVRVQHIQRGQVSLQVLGMVEETVRRRRKN